MDGWRWACCASRRRTRFVGRISDDGFEIGQISLATVFLLAITTGLGAIVGVVYIVVRRALPGGWGRWGWIFVGATVGGSLLLHADGVDFNLLEPTWLAVALFILIPAGGAALMAFWVERWDRWWLTDRRRTIIAALPTVVLIPLIFPVLVAAAAVVLVAIGVAERQDSLRHPDRRPSDRAGRAGDRGSLVVVGAVQRHHRDPVNVAGSSRCSASWTSSPISLQSAILTARAHGEEITAEAEALVVRLFHQEGRSLVRLARLFVDDRDAAEDLVQEAFLRLARSAHRITDIDRAPAYLRSIVLNLARDHNRRGLVSLRHHPTSIGRAVGRRARRRVVRSTSRTCSCSRRTTGW